MLNRDALMPEVLHLIAQLEKRRRRYLAMLYLNVLLAILILLWAIAMPRESLVWLAEAVGRSHAISQGEVASFVFFGFFCALSLLQMPLLRYNGGVKAECGLERLAMLRLCELLGNCTIAPPATSLIHIAQRSGLFPANAGISERAGIKGIAGNYNYTLQEMAVANGQGECLFRGLAIHCTPLKHSLLKAASNPLGAEAALQEMAGYCASLPERKAQWDSKLIQRLQKLVEFLRERFSAASHKSPLAAEIAYDAQFSAAPDMLRTRQSSCSPFNGTFAVAELKNGWFLAFPCNEAIFASASLFMPVIGESQAEFFYRLHEFVGLLPQTLPSIKPVM